MKALVFHGIGKISLDEVKKPKIKNNFDALVKITTSAICGTDLHFIRGTMGSVEKGTMLGHEAVKIIRKCGTISIIGVYPPEFMIFPIGEAMNKNLKIVMGNCPHRAYIPQLLSLIEDNRIDPLTILTQKQSLSSIMEAYEHFDSRCEGWIKVALRP